MGLGNFQDQTGGKGGYFAWGSSLYSASAKKYYFGPVMYNIFLCNDFLYYRDFLTAGAIHEVNVDCKTLEKVTTQLKEDKDMSGKTR